MKYQIKKIFTGEIIYEGEAKSFKEFVEKNKFNLSYADLSYADFSNINLSYTNFSNSNFSYTDFSNSNLSYTNLFNAKIKITQKEDLLKALKIKIIN